MKQKLKHHKFIIILLLLLIPLYVVPIFNNVIDKTDTPLYQRPYQDTPLRDFYSGPKSCMEWNSETKKFEYTVVTSEEERLACLNTGYDRYTMDFQKGFEWSLLLFCQKIYFYFVPLLFLWSSLQLFAKQNRKYKASFILSGILSCISVLYFLAFTAGLV